MSAVAGVDVHGSPVHFDHASADGSCVEPVAQPERLLEEQEQPGHYRAGGILQRKTDDDRCHAEGCEESSDVRVPHPLEQQGEADDDDGELDDVDEDRRDALPPRSSFSGSEKSEVQQVDDDQDQNEAEDRRHDPRPVHFGGKVVDLRQQDKKCSQRESEVSDELDDRRRPIAALLEYTGYQAGLALRMAIPRMTDDDIAQTVALIDAKIAASDADDIPTLYAAARSLYAFVSARTGNTVFAMMMRETGLAMERNLRGLRPVLGDVAERGALYRELRAAVVARDREAAERAVREQHGLGSRTLLIIGLEEFAPKP